MDFGRATGVVFGVGAVAFCLGLVAVRDGLADPPLEPFGSGVFNQPPVVAPKVPEGLPSWVGLYFDWCCCTLDRQMRVSAKTVEYEELGCFHSYEAQATVLREIPGGLRLRVEAANASGPSPQMLDTELYFYSCDGATYCMQRRSLLRWIHELNTGVVRVGEDRKFGERGLRRKDVWGRAVGETRCSMPEFPKPIADRLLSKPLVVKFVETGPESVQEEPTGLVPIRHWAIRFEFTEGVPLSLGQGFTVEDANGEIGLVEVQSVVGTSATGELVYSGMMPFVPPAVGQVVRFSGELPDPKLDVESAPSR
ncbi:MAG: hypothetical protein JSR52_07275 [Planctomycetes bacterium]|nr:hypothetical protein [Planctomycetota bacterium]